MQPDLVGGRGAPRVTMAALLCGADGLTRLFATLAYPNVLSGRFLPRKSLEGVLTGATDRQVRDAARNLLLRHSAPSTSRGASQEDSDASDDEENDPDWTPLCEGDEDQHRNLLAVDSFIVNTFELDWLKAAKIVGSTTSESSKVTMVNLAFAARIATAVGAGAEVVNSLLDALQSTSSGASGNIFCASEAHRLAATPVSSVVPMPSVMPLLSEEAAKRFGTGTYGADMGSEPLRLEITKLQDWFTAALQPGRTTGAPLAASSFDNLRSSTARVLGFIQNVLCVDAPLSLRLMAHGGRILLYIRWGIERRRE